MVYHGILKIGNGSEFSESQNAHIYKISLPLGLRIEEKSYGKSKFHIQHMIIFYFVTNTSKPATLRAPARL